MHHRKFRAPWMFVLGGCALAMLASGCASAPKKSPPSAPPPAGARVVPELKPGIPAGYLSKADYPDSLALLPPPPEPGSPAFANDVAVHDAAMKLRGTPRYELAIRDAVLDHDAPNTFSCAVGAPIDPQNTPRLFQMLMRAAIDAGLSTYGAKNHYQRVRPFVHFNESTCYPKDEESLRKDGSYPSGHTTLGWAQALVLVQVDPANANAILARGRGFGESRLVCNAHWQSDILQGRFMGASTVALLSAKPEFREDIEVARAELATVRTKGLPPARDCATEAAALAQKISGVQ